MRKSVSLFVLAILCSTQQEMHAQDGYFANWFDRVDKTRGEQPDWITPMATTTACLREGYRYDQVWRQDRRMKEKPQIVSGRKSRGCDVLEGQSQQVQSESSSLWHCPRCGASMVVIQRFTAAELAVCIYFDSS
jgi:hypothetical protein